MAGGPGLADSIARAAGVVRAQVGASADLVFVFVSHHFREVFDRVASLVQEHLPARVLVGCSAGGVVGGGEEVENEPAVSLTAARLPGVELRPIHTDTQDLPDADAPPEVWRSWLGLRQTGHSDFVVLADPFSTALEPFLTGLDYAFPGTTVVGGLASGGQEAGDHALWVGSQLHRRGLVALSLSGNIAVDTIVAQGCRPIGAPLTVTRCRENLLLEVDRQPPLRYLAGLVETLSEYDRQLMRTSLFLGVELADMDRAPDVRPYLIRNLVGIDYGRGVLAVGSPLREGQVVQFHLRDKVTSAGDLDVLLERAHAAAGPHPPRGALLFACLGRGRHLYGEVNHDSRCFAERFGPVPLGGFFCSGEIGPVARATHLHGYTSSFALFREKGKKGDVPAARGPGHV